ncbi:hypothetical protein [Prescottella agglutinans]|uniref:Uncharacterized protein n=1 Tax=Prescottella agglutinans TaxID=1644129 RepID=A0ABT6MIA7_9NOCA|nr:hypothetical protein [Prescottella agglutinans]MDH6284032.1 hypothetical protein [Prescottella agglutinans]
MTATGQGPELAFCEPGNAVAMGKIHVRVVGAGRPERGAGLPAGTEALCGRDLDYGWDLDGDVTTESVDQRSRPRAGDGHVWLCRGCADAYTALATQGLLLTCHTDGIEEARMLRARKLTVTFDTLTTVDLAAHRYEIYFDGAWRHVRGATKTVNFFDRPIVRLDIANYATDGEDIYRTGGEVELRRVSWDGDVIDIPLAMM